MKAYIIITLVSIAAICGSCRKLNKRADPINTPQQKDWTNKIPELQVHNTGKITIKEGVTGTLSYKEGDCMPMVGGPNTSCKEYPVKGIIRLYSYTLENEVKRDSEHNIIAINSKLVASAQTDIEGFYQLKVPPGNYSLVMEYKGKLYNFSSDGNGGLQPVTVVLNTAITAHAVIDKAVY